MWTWEEARDFCTLCLPYVNVLFGIEPYYIWKNEENHSAGDVKDGIPFQPDFGQQEKVFRAFADRYPNIKCIARHVRFAHSCSENSLMAYLWLNGKTYESKRLTFHILDRVGGGDAFVSGINAKNLEEYLSCDKILCCGGSWMVKGDLVKAGEFDKIKELTAEARKLADSIRK